MIKKIIKKINLKYFLLTSIIVVFSITGITIFSISYNKEKARLIEENKKLQLALENAANKHDSLLDEIQLVETEKDDLSDDHDDVLNEKNNLLSIQEQLNLEMIQLENEISQVNLEIENYDLQIPQLILQINNLENEINNFSNGYKIQMINNIEDEYYIDFIEQQNSLNAALDVSNFMITNFNDDNIDTSLKTMGIQYHLNQYIKEEIIFYYATDNEGNILGAKTISFKCISFVEKYTKHSISIQNLWTIEDFGFPINYKGQVFEADEIQVISGNIEINNPVPTKYLVKYYDIFGESLQFTSEVYFYKGIEVDGVIYSLYDSNGDLYFQVGHDYCEYFYEEGKYYNCAGVNYVGEQLILENEIYFLDQLIPVKTINYFAFRSSMIKELVLPENIVEVKAMAFSNSNIHRLIIYNDAFVIETGYKVFDANVEVTVYVTTNNLNEYVDLSENDDYWGTTLAIVLPLQ